jgi:glycerate dehydrogenase
LICEFATGYDNVDLEYCKSKGIGVANVVDYSTAAVAQHTFAMALYLLERLPFYDNYVKSGTYGSQKRFSNFDKSFTELEGKTWGIIGLGNIGKKTAKIAEGFGCHVIYYSVTGKNNSTEYEKVDLDDLLKRSDFISIHCPLSDLTRNLIDFEAMKKMKKTAILLNVARGPVVNNKDLYKALAEDEIYAAGLDVLEKEPIQQDNPLGLIKDSEKLIITPHMAWASTEARTRLAGEVYKNIEAFTKGEKRNIVNP